MVMLITVLSALGVLVQGLDLTSRSPEGTLSNYVRLSLSSERETYYPGEALQLRITAVNAGDRPVTASFGALHPVMFGEATLYWRPPGVGQFSELDLRAEMPSGAPEDLRRSGPHARSATLHPGQGFGFEVPIAFVVRTGSRRFVLRDIGPYAFKLRYGEKRRDSVRSVLESNVLTVEVVEPPASEREACAAYTPELAKLAQDGMARSLSPEEMRAAADFVERFPRSLYAAPVKSGLRSALERSKRKGRANHAAERLYMRIFGDEASNVPPILNVSLSTSMLWPADNAMVPLTARVRVLDREGRDDLTATVSLLSITCDDSCELANDVLGAEYGTDDRAFELRADRGRSGVGRTYTVKYSAERAAGDRVSATAKVTVPHNQVPSAWSAAGVRYGRGDVVTHGGYTWRSTETHTSDPMFSPGGFPTVGPFWVKLPKGPGWDYPVQYAAGVEVTFGGFTFRCREAHVSQGESPPPSSPAHWERVR